MSQTRVINGPHIRTDRTTRNVMMNVAISLVPALLGAIYFFGIRALYLAGLSITVCVLTEFFWQKITKKQVIAGDFSAVVTGLLLVLNMPVTVPIWTLVAADVFSILVVKQMFGGIPLIRRNVTVTGCVKQPGNYLVPVGTSAKELVELCGGVTVKENRIIAGGPMTGPCVASDWDGEEELFYVTKNTSGILVLPDSQQEEQPCIRCMGCENVCPVGLVPCEIEYAFLEEDYDLCESLHASECIACGCCSYTCPAKRELSVRTRMARDMVKQRMRERAVKKA